LISDLFELYEDYFVNGKIREDSIKSEKYYVPMQIQTIYELGNELREAQEDAHQIFIIMRQIYNQLRNGPYHTFYLWEMLIQYGIRISTGVQQCYHIVINDGTVDHAINVQGREPTIEAVYDFVNSRTREPYILIWEGRQLPKNGDMRKIFFWSKDTIYLEQNTKMEKIRFQTNWDELYEDFVDVATEKLSYKNITAETYYNVPSQTSSPYYRSRFTTRTRELLIRIIKEMVQLKEELFKMALPGLQDKIERIHNVGHLVPEAEEMITILIGRMSNRMTEGSAIITAKLPNNIQHTFNVDYNTTMCQLKGILIEAIRGPNPLTSRYPNLVICYQGKILEPDNKLIIAHGLCNTHQIKVFEEEAVDDFQGVRRAVIEDERDLQIIFTYFGQVIWPRIWRGNMNMANCGKTNGTDNDSNSDNERDEPTLKQIYLVKKRSDPSNSKTKSNKSKKTTDTKKNSGKSPRHENDLTDEDSINRGESTMNNPHDKQKKGTKSTDSLKPRERLEQLDQLIKDGKSRGRIEKCLRQIDRTEYDLSELENLSKKLINLKMSRNIDTPTTRAIIEYWANQARENRVRELYQFNLNIPGEKPRSLNVTGDMRIQEVKPLLGYKDNYGIVINGQLYDENVYIATTNAEVDGTNEIKLRPKPNRKLIRIATKEKAEREDNEDETENATDSVEEYHEVQPTAISTPRKSNKKVAAEKQNERSTLELMQPPPIEMNKSLDLEEIEIIADEDDQVISDVDSTDHEEKEQRSLREYIAKVLEPKMSGGQSENSTMRSPVKRTNEPRERPIVDIDSSTEDIIASLPQSIVPKTTKQITMDQYINPRHHE